MSDENISSSIRNETKEKFDALLKSALQKKKRNKSKSKQNLISDDSSISSTENKAKIKELVEVDVHNKDEESKTFILDKFLNDAKSELNETTFVKPPIPKPRTKKQRSIDSNTTYKVKTSTSTTSQSLQSNRTYTLNKTSSSDTINSNIEEIKSLEIRDSSREKLKKQYDSDVDINTRSDSNTSPKSLKHNKIMYEDKIKPKPRKKVRKSKTKTEKTENDIEISENTPLQYNYDQIMGITIHRTDALTLESYVIHPIVKIHLVDGETGEYLKKTDDNRSVVFYYEDKKIKYIVPVMTQAYNLQERRTLFPCWEETIVINEDYNYFLKDSTNVILFFELLDFMSFSDASSFYSPKDATNGWHKIAWAFLKLVGKNNILNAGNKIRLQFYLPGKTKKVASNVCEVYRWWKNRKLTKYPSTLHVTVKALVPQKLIETFRSKTPVQGEVGSGDILEFSKGGAHDPAAKKVVPTNTNTMSYCQMLQKKSLLPNTCVSKLESHEEGCFVMKFSHDGLHLACAVLIDNTYTIVIYSIDTFTEVYRFPGHQGLIYGINWSKDDKTIVSASADATVCIWDFNNHNFLQMLPHPSFVYCAEISNQNLIATGCYDRTLRLWSKRSKTDYAVVQEFERHEGFITSICFNKKSDLILTADSVGVIMQWEFSEQNNWTFKRDIVLLEIKGTVINNILLHKKEKRLLIHSRDSALRLLDLKTMYILHWLKENMNKRFQTFSCFSPCGSYTFSGSENNEVNVWNVYTGKLIATYLPYGSCIKDISIHCVQFHPNENMLAISHYGRKLPILLYKYNSEVSNNKVNLKIVEELIKDSSKVLIQNKPENNVKKRQSNKIQGRGSFKIILEKMDQIITPK